MSISFIYFDSKHAIRVHDWIIKHSGGSPGNNNLDLLESPLGHIQNDFYYPEIENKLSHLVFSINKNHAFVDGNKRSSIALGAYFLELNGYEYCIKEFVHKMENISVWIADSVISKDLTEEIVTSIIYDDDYSEVLKMKIANAISQKEIERGAISFTDRALIPCRNSKTPRFRKNSSSRKQMVARRKKRFI
jgi:death-on-curing protein